MTKPLIKLPSVELREAREALDKAYAELADIVRKLKLSHYQKDDY